MNSALLFFFAAPGFTWEVTLKKGQNNIRSFNWYQYVFNGRKSIRGGICHSIHRSANVNDKYMKDYDKKKESLYRKYWNVNNLYRTKLSYNKICSWKFISHSNEKTQILMNKPVYLGLSILEISKIVMWEFWYDYLKLKYVQKLKLYHKDKDSFIVYLKTENIYRDISKDV